MPVFRFSSGEMASPDWDDGVAFQNSAEEMEAMHAALAPHDRRRSLSVAKVYEELRAVKALLELRPSHYGRIDKRFSERLIRISG